MCLVSACFLYLRLLLFGRVCCMCACLVWSLYVCVVVGLCVLLVRVWYCWFVRGVVGSCLFVCVCVFAVVWLCLLLLVCGSLCCGVCICWCWFVFDVVDQCLLLLACDSACFVVFLCVFAVVVVWVCLWLLLVRVWFCFGMCVCCGCFACVVFC